MVSVDVKPNVSFHQTDSLLRWVAADGEVCVGGGTLASGVSHSYVLLLVGAGAGSRVHKPQPLKRKVSRI